MTGAFVILRATIQSRLEFRCSKHNSDLASKHRRVEMAKLGRIRVRSAARFCLLAYLTPECYLDEHHHWRKSMIEDTEDRGNIRTSGRHCHKGCSMLSDSIHCDWAEHPSLTLSTRSAAIARHMCRSPVDRNDWACFR